MNEPSLHEALTRASRAIGHPVEVVEHFAASAEGAFLVTIAGAPYVFKHWTGEQIALLDLSAAVRAHALLAQSGWPLPAIHAWHSDEGLAYTVEHYMAGQRIHSVSPRLCDQLLLLLERAPRDVADPGATPRRWVSFLEQSLHHDHPYPHRPLALERTPRGEHVVWRARAAFAAARPALLAARDVIHGDFSAGNILCDPNGDLAAVFDWQRSGVGHRGFDLVGLQWDLALRLDAGSTSSLHRVSALVDAQVEPTVRTCFQLYYAVWNFSWALGTPDEMQVRRAAEIIGVL